jgi:rRNA-processing protein EBP2
MVTKSKLKMALAAEKGTDFKRLHLKKKEKVARKVKGKKGGGEGEVVNGNGDANGKKGEEEWEDFEEELEGEDESGSEEEVDGPMKVCFPAYFCISL